ncbi:hypothetical protein TNCV_4648501 [Trichonephila clavipes]|uniref:Uncharacterized protein n=1 Tax=Trichonephila clavipes TaxID=2585209 RepID=A0A8X6SY04_TRICX|nr:hypothetical protein TNCV_4648501 [Trichonephila clavipes]
MGMPYHLGIKAIVDGITTHILFRQGQSQTNAVKAQDYGISVLGSARRFAGELHASRNNDQLSNCTEAPKSIAKQTVRHAVKICFAPPQ